MRSINFAVMFGLIHLCAACSQRAPEPNAKNEKPDPAKVLGDKRTAEREKKRLYYAAIEEKAIAEAKKRRKGEFGHESLVNVLDDNQVDGIWATCSRGHQFAASYNDNWFRIWDIASGKLTHKIRSHRDSAEVMAYSADGKGLAWFRIPGGPQLYECKLNNKLHDVISFEWEHLEGVAYSPDAKTIAISGMINLSESRIELRDAVTKTVIRKLRVPLGSGRIQFSPNGRLLAARTGRSVVIWETINWNQFQKIETKNKVDEFAFSPDGWSIAISSRENFNKFELWDLAEMTKKDLPTIWGFGKGVSFDPKGRYIAYATQQTLAVWDPVGGKLIARVSSSDEPDLVSGRIRFSAGGRLLISGYSSIYIWDFEELLKKYAINK